MPPLSFAAPSCVIPAPVAENAFFLAHKVQEVGLCFFETQSCLRYTEKDLPQELKALPLRWHVHLPVDLPWSAKHKGGVGAARKAVAVFQKAAYLRPRYAVLHPPTFEQDPSALHQLLYDFLHTWKKHISAPLLLENIHDGDLCSLDPELFAKDAYGVCLDIGHMLAFGQQGVLQRADLLRRVQLVHWSAPGKRDEHLPLTEFTPSQKDSIAHLVPLLPRQATHMIEVFRWQGVDVSAPFLHSTLERHHGEKN